MLSSFLHALNKLAAPSDQLLVAVSGGIDSMLLLSLLEKSNFSFSIAHCNFGLRKEASDEDERFIKQYAEQKKIPFYSTKFDTKQFANDHRLGIQEAARHLRYEWFEQLATIHWFSKIVTAHHFNDSIETFFINLLRKSGPAGLAGIPQETGKIIRPLLNITRKQIELYAAENEIPYREDASNATDVYLRNRLRHHLIPFLYDETFEDDMHEIMDSFKFIDEYQTTEVSNWMLQHSSQIGDSIHLQLAALKTEEDPAEFLSMVLYQLNIYPAETQKILQAKSAGKQFETRNHIILHDREELIIQAKTENVFKDKNIYHLPYTLENESNSYRFSKEKGNEIRYQSDVMYVDDELLRLPLTIRKWQDGDRFCPLGMEQMKKVSDFLIDRKVNVFDKEKTLLLLSGTDIVCILGHRIDHRFRVTPETTHMLVITAL